MHSLQISLVVLLAGATLLGCDDAERAAHRRRESERRAQPLRVGDPAELAVQLRQRADPDPTTGSALVRFNLREVVSPSEPVRELREVGITSALTGFATQADRSRLPEFTSAEFPEGRSVREHLNNAILMNTSRMGYYAERAGEKRSKSLWLSRYMVVGETVSLPGVARWDGQAQGLVARGLPPLHEDLVPLRPLPRETPPTWRGIASKAQRRAVKELTEHLRDDLNNALQGGRLQDVAAHCHRAIEQLMQWEQEWGMHWQMTRHTIGSVGYAALRGDEHQDPERRELSVRYVESLVKHTLSYGRAVDRMAQPLHAEGLGIVVNEFTDQPFLQAYHPSQPGAVQVLSARH